MQSMGTIEDEMTILRISYGVAFPQTLADQHAPAKTINPKEPPA